LSKYLVVLDFVVICERSEFGSAIQPLVPEVSLLDGLQEEHALVDLTQLDLNAPVLDTVNFFIRQDLSLIQEVLTILENSNRLINK